MARFMIEVSHEGNARDCTRAIELFHKTGSHFLTHADWGCKDGEHKAWITVEMDSKAEALAIVPTLYRGSAKIVQLNPWTEADLQERLRQYGG